MFNTIVSFACICYVSVCIWQIKYYYYYYCNVFQFSVRRHWTSVKCRQYIKVETIHWMQYSYSLLANSYPKQETHMHSLEANASPAGRVSVTSQDIVGGRIFQILTYSNSKFSQFKETFSPLRLTKFHWHLLNGLPLRGEKLQRSHIRFLRKNAFSNLCPLLPTTGDTSEKFYKCPWLHSFRYLMPHKWLH